MSFVEDGWWSATTFAAFAIILAWVALSSVREAARTTRSAQAAAQWPPERIRALVLDTGTPGSAHEVAAVRTLRRADRRLSLLDALTLVRTAR